MFEKGDRLVYGVNGVCTVEEMRSLEIAPGSSRDYYVLRPLNDPKTTLSVPVDSPLTSRMRPLKTPEEIKLILKSSAECVMNWIDNRIERNAKFKEIMINGECRELYMMLLCLKKRRHSLAVNGKRLSAGDNAMMTSVQRVLRDELCCSLDITLEEADRLLAG